MKLSSQATIDAINRLNADVQANGGYFTIDLMITDEADAADSRTEYLIKEGAGFRDAVVQIYTDLSQIANDPNVEQVSNALQAYSTTEYNKYRRAINSLKSIVQAIEAAATEPWDILDAANNPLKDGMTTAEFRELDALVYADGNTAYHTDAALTSLFGAAVTVSTNVNQFDVTVIVQANRIAASTIDSADTTALEEHRTVLSILKDSSAADIEAAITASGIEADTLTAWGVIDTANYDRTAGTLPATLTENITYTIVYNPKSLQMTYDFTGLPATVPYGYNMTLPVYPGTNKVYDYVVNGTSYLQGKMIQITGDTVITRTEGTPWDVKGLAELVAGSYAGTLTADEQAVLASIALNSTDILYRSPKNEDGLITISSSGGVNTVNAAEFASDHAGLRWKPLSGKALKDGAEVASLNLTSGSDTFSGDYDSVEVRYVLTFSDITESDILTELNLIKALAEEAKAQKDDMAVLNSQYSQFEQLDQATLNKIKTGVDGSDMSQASKDAVRAILNGCVDRNEGRLYLYGYLSNYRTDGLAYYYQNDNYKLIRSQVEILRTNFAVVYNDPEFLPLLQDIEAEENYEKIGNVLQKLNSVVIPGPNDRIDVTSPSLGTLVDAINSVIGSERAFTSASDPITAFTTLTAASPDRAVVTITVQQKNSAGSVLGTASDTAVFSKNTALTAADIQYLEGKIQALVTSLGIDTAHYSTADTLAITAGSQLTDNAQAAFTYQPNRYTTSIRDLAGTEITTLTFSYDAPSITLPACTEEGKKYRYTVAGTTYTVGTDAKIVTFSAANISSGAYQTVTRETIDVNRETLLDLIYEMNKAGGEAGMVDGDKLCISFIPMENANGDITIILRVTLKNAEKAEDAVAKIAEALVGSNFTYVKSGDNYIREDSSMSLQGILDMLLQGEFSLDTFMNAITEDGFINEMTPPAGYTVIGQVGDDIPVGSKRVNDVNMVGGKLFETTLTFAQNATEAGLTAKLYITLEDFGQSTDDLKDVRKGIAKIRDYANVKADNGKLAIDATLPEKAYKLYLAALLALDYVKLNDLGAPDMVEVVNMLLDYLDQIVSDETITMDTFENTLAKANADRDLSDYSKIYSDVRKAINNILDNAVFSNETGTGSTYSADIHYDITALLDELNVKQTLRGLIKEETTGIDVGLKVSMNNSADYEALIIDPDASGTDKLNFINSVATALPTLHTDAVVVLLKDINADLTFPRGASLDLNSHVLNGNVNAQGGLVTIFDSAVATDSGAAVTGTVSGNLKITAGRYNADVTAYLEDGYVQESGVVRNGFYKVEEAGNAINIHITPEVDVLDVATSDTARLVAIELAVDLVVNNFQGSSMKIGGYDIYAVEVQDIISLLDGVTNEKANEILSAVSCPGITALANDILNKILDFGALGAAIQAGTPFATYEVLTNPWDLELEHIANGDYLTGNVKPETGRSTSKTVRIYMDDNAGMSDTLIEMGKVITADAEVELTSISYADKKITLVGSGFANVTIDVRDYKDYVVTMAVAIADATADAARKDALKAAIENYYDTGKTPALKDAFDTVTTEDLMSALVSTRDFGDMVADLGLTGVVQASVTDLYATYESVLKVFKFLNEQTSAFTGSDRALSTLATANYGEYAATSSDRTKSQTFSASGFTGVLNLTLESSSLTAKLFKEELYKVEVFDENDNPLYQGDDLNEAFDEVIAGCRMEVHEDIELTADASLAVELTMTGAEYVTLGTYKINLTTAAAKLTADWEITSIVATTVDYAEVKVSGAYVYQPYIRARFYSVGGEITESFVMKITALLGFEGETDVYQLRYVNTTPVHVPVTIDGTEFTNNGMRFMIYAFTVNPEEFTDDLFLELVTGTEVADTRHYSIAQYCKAVADLTADDSLKTLLADLLEYGAAAQLYFEHSINDLANSDTYKWTGYQASAYTAPQADDMVFVKGENDATFHSANLYLVKDTVRLQFKGVAPAGATFKLSKDGVELTDAETEVTDMINYRNFVLKTAPIAMSQLTTGRYKAEMTAGSVTSSVEYSVANYVLRVNESTVISDEMKTLAQRLWVYGESAKTYYASH
ncbi:MAG: hypothetical protein IK088_06845 [Lachnospiraceae bacterium]|nr:hypothetical protein [Lachnospiraceae bacterium]